MAEHRLFPYFLILGAGVIWGATFSLALIATAEGRAAVVGQGLHGRHQVGQEVQNHAHITVIFPQIRHELACISIHKPIVAADSTPHHWEIHLRRIRGTGQPCQGPRKGPTCCLPGLASRPAGRGCRFALTDRDQQRPPTVSFNRAMWRPVVTGLPAECVSSVPDISCSGRR